VLRLYAEYLSLFEIQELATLRLTTVLTIALMSCVTPAFSQLSVSKEYANVIHSPAAKSTPKIFRFVLQMEVVIRKGEADAEIIDANGTAVSKDGLLVSVIAEPGENQDENGGIESATVLNLDGGGVAASLVSYAPEYGVAVFRANGLKLPPIAQSTASHVTNRRVNWRTVYRQGDRTVLYSRPLRVHAATHEKAETKDLCEMIDPGTSALSAPRSGSVLIALDGTLLGIMGRLKHWNVTPKNTPPRRKLAWAVPAKLIARLIDEARNSE